MHPFAGARVFLVNVGANAAHRVRSPLFSDGRFELLPIPEERALTPSPSTAYDRGEHDAFVRYGDLRSFYNPSSLLDPFIPPSIRDTPCHYDPEWETPTYGDNCDSAPRAVALRGARPGDVLLFLARLVPWRDGVFAGPPGFYLVGLLEVESVLASVRAAPPQEEMGCFGHNAHLRRAMADSRWYNGFWVFRGSARSQRFRCAVPLTPVLCDAVLRDARGEAWRWDGVRTPLQVIGSYTRTCRCVLDPVSPGDAARAEVLWEALRRVV